MKKIFFAIVSLLILAQTAVEAKITVKAPSLVGLEEEFNVIVSIDASNSISVPAWNPGDDFQLVWGPQEISSGTSFTSINGKSSTRVEKQFKYILRSHKSGDFSLPPVSAVVDGAQAFSQKVSVRVATNGASSAPDRKESNPAEDIRKGKVENFLSFSISKRNPYLGEPLKATLKLYTRAAHIEGFQNIKFPTFNGFWSQQTFSPAFDNLGWQREELNDKIYISAVLGEYTLIPQQAGAVTIDPAEITLIASFPVENDFYDPFMGTIMQQVARKAVSAKYVVNVKAHPNGAPESFDGAVGTYSIAMDSLESGLKTHEASSLRITISGQGNIIQCEAPKISFPHDFEVYDPKVSEDLNADKTSGSKTFEYPFIPRSDGNFEIPAVEFSFMNPATGRYETVSTDPISLVVAKGNDPGKAGGGIFSGSAGKDVETLDSDIRYIKVNNPGLETGRNDFALSLVFHIIAFLVIAVAAGFYFTERKLTSRRSDTVGVRKRGAVKIAEKRLARAGEHLKANRYSEFYEELHRALLGFAGDKLNMDSSSLSKDNISSVLVGSAVSAETASRFTSLLDACEYARYSPDNGNEAMSAHYNEAVTIISDIASVMKKSGKIKAKSSVAALLVILFFAPQAYSQSSDSLWTSAVRNYEAGNWKASYDEFRKIEASGVETEDLYYNIGNAAFRCDSLAKAILYYERALKLNPTNRDARHNLLFCNNKIKDKIEAVPEFFLKSGFRKLSRSMSSDSWAVIFLVLLTSAVSAALLFLLAKSRFVKKIGFFSGIVLLLLAVASYSFMFRQKSEMSDKSHAIISSPTVNVLSSPGANGSKNLFVLHEGTKVRIKDVVGGWKNIVLSDGREGWIEDRNLDII